MILTSYAFIIFLSITLGVYNLVPASTRASLLLLAGYVLYSGFGWKNVAILVAITLCTYLFGVALGRHKSALVLLLAVISSAAPLLFWKTERFLENGGNPTFSGFAIPIGLSFFTLQAIGYLLDVYWRRIPAQSSLFVLALFLAFFPIMLAGPIERGGKLMPQLTSLPKTSPAGLFFAAKQLLWGFFCKLVIADKVGLIASDLMHRPEDALSLAGGLVVYSFQIYFDFYGYAIIAQGTARLFGISIIANFNHPYLARSLADFWHRWHISLSTWFRDYIFLPIAYRCNLAACSVVMVLVFILSGFWHGASFNFLLWGGMHGLLYVVGRFTEKPRNRFWCAIFRGRCQQFRFSIQALCTFSLVSLAWIFFVIPDTHSALETLGLLFVGSWSIRDSMVATLLQRPDFAWYGFCATLFFALDSAGIIQAVVERKPQTGRQLVQELLIINCLVVLLVLIGEIGARGFIYMQF